MHEVESIRKLAEKLDPNPGNKCLEAYRSWRRRHNDRTRTVHALATPGALLGAAVDLLRHKFSPAEVAAMIHRATYHATVSEDPDLILSALIAAMEEVEI